MPEMLDDLRLVAQLNRGNKDALRTIYERYRRDLFTVAVSKQGICSEAVSKSSKARHLVLQPWSRVQGVVRSGDGKPLSGQALEMASLPEADEASGFRWSLSTETVDPGVFQVEWVPPGKFTLLGKTYEVAPGQTLNLDLTFNP